MFSSGWQSKRIMHERYKNTHMKSCSRTRNVCPDAIVLTEASCLSPLACPSFRKEYMSTELPTRSVVMSLRAHSPFSNKSLVFSSLLGLAFLPVARFLVEHVLAGGRITQKNQAIANYHGA